MRRPPNSTGGRNRCTPCSATRSSRTSASWRWSPRATCLPSRPGWPRTRCGRSVPTRSAPSKARRCSPPASRPFYCLAVAGLSQERADLSARRAGLLRARPDARRHSRNRGLPATRRSWRPATPTLAVETPVYRGGDRSRHGGRTPAARSWAGSASCSCPKVVLGTGARRSSQRGRHLPLRLTPVSCRVHQRQRSSAAIRARRSTSTTGGACRASGRRSQAACRATGTRSRC